MEPSATPQQAVGRDALRGLTVLVVDDEPILASTFCLVLQFAGAVSHSAANGRIALAMTGYQSFDIILCDRSMPVMSGLDFIREFRKRGNTTPILLLTGSVVDDIHAEFADLQVSGTVSKPILPAELIATIRDTLSRRSDEPGPLHP